MLPYVSIVVHMVTHHRQEHIFPDFCLVTSNYATFPGFVGWVATHDKCSSTPTQQHKFTGVTRQT